MAAKKTTSHRSIHQRPGPLEKHYQKRHHGEKDPEDKEAMVLQLAETSMAVAMLLEAGVEVYDAETWRSLGFGLCSVLRAAVDPVCLYVIGSPGVLAYNTRPKHLIHALKKTLSRLKA